MKRLRKWMNKYPLVIFVLASLYMMFNGIVVTMCFINAEKLGYSFLPVIGLIFAGNLFIQAMIMKKREMQTLRYLYGEDYAEILKDQLKRKRKGVKKHHEKKNKWISY